MITITTFHFLSLFISVALQYGINELSEPSERLPKRAISVIAKLKLNDFSRNYRFRVQGSGFKD